MKFTTIILILMIISFNSCDIDKLPVAMSEANSLNRYIQNYMKPKYDADEEYNFVFEAESRTIVLADNNLHLLNISASYKKKYIGSFSVGDVNINDYSMKYDETMFCYTYTNNSDSSESIFKEGQNVISFDGNSYLGIAPSTIKLSSALPFNKLNFDKKNIGKDEDLTIHWNADNQIGAKLVIHICNDRMPYFGHCYEIDDTGKYTIPSDKFDVFPEGSRIILSVGRYVEEVNTSYMFKYTADYYISYSISVNVFRKK